MERETDLSRRGTLARAAAAQGASDGYPVCPRCGHHTSAYCGACTAFVMEADGTIGYCGCDCVVAMGGKSLADTIAEAVKRQDGAE